MIKKLEQVIPTPYDPTVEKLNEVIDMVNKLLEAHPKLIAHTQDFKSHNQFVGGPRQK